MIEVALVNFKQKLNKILFVGRRFFINIQTLFENLALAKIFKFGRSSI